MEITLKLAALSQDELMQGSILSPLTIKVFENDLSSLANRALNLAYDPAKPLEYMQELAALKGEINNINFIIMRSDQLSQQLAASQQEGN